MIPWWEDERTPVYFFSKKNKARSTEYKGTEEIRVKREIMKRILEKQTHLGSVTGPLGRDECPFVFRFSPILLITALYPLFMCLYFPLDYKLCETRDQVCFTEDFSVLGRRTWHIIAQYSLKYYRHAQSLTNSVKH